MNDANGQLLLFEDTIDELAPYAGVQLPYYAHPVHDGQRLMNYQHDYLLFNSTESWHQLWTLTLTVAGRIIEAERRKKGFYLSADEKADKQTEAAEYLLRRYRTRRGYYIRTGFIAAIRHSVQHALYYRNLTEQLTDYVSIEHMERIPDERYEGF